MPLYLKTSKKYIVIGYVQRFRPSLKQHKTTWTLQQLNVTGLTRITFSDSPEEDCLRKGKTYLFFYPLTILAGVFYSTSFQSLYLAALMSVKNYLKSQKSSKEVVLGRPCRRQKSWDKLQRRLNWKTQCFIESVPTLDEYVEIKDEITTAAAILGELAVEWLWWALVASYYIIATKMMRGWRVGTRSHWSEKHCFTKWRSAL